MDFPKKTIGRSGEKAAAKYLQQQGYTILEKNYRVSGAEVDLIAQTGETIVFVEVKTRGTDEYGMPEEFVHKSQRRRIIRAAKVYTADEKYVDCYVRFDIIALLHQDGEALINHIQHAFEEE